MLNNFINTYLSKCHDVSLSINRRGMDNSLLDSSWRCASNGGIFMSLASIDEKLFEFYVLETFTTNVPFIDARDMTILPFNAHHHDESNELLSIPLRSIESETPWHFSMQQLIFDNTNVKQYVKQFYQYLPVKMSRCFALYQS